MSIRFWRFHLEVLLNWEFIYRYYYGMTFVLLCLKKENNFHQRTVSLTRDNRIHWVHWSAGVWAWPSFFTSFLCCRSITRAYYRNSVGGLLLFDITNRRSFQNVHEWLEETKVHVQPYQIVFVLVGHKCDLDTQRQVTRHEAEKLAAAYGMKYIETSARDAINVEKAFTDLTRDIYELVKRGDITIQEGWEGVKSGFVPNVVHSSEEVVKSERRCLC